MNSTALKKNKAILSLKNLFAVAFVIAGISMDVWAGPIKSIEIDGLRKIEKEVILSKLKSKAQQEYSAQSVKSQERKIHGD